MTTHNDKAAYFVIGIALGLLGGLLLAPRSGEEIREDVRRRTQGGLDYLNQQAERVRERTEQAVNKTREWLSRQRGAEQTTTGATESPFSEESTWPGFEAFPIVPWKCTLSFTRAT
jgi:gas vesicle protein